MIFPKFYLDLICRGWDSKERADPLGCLGLEVGFWKDQMIGMAFVSSIGKYSATNYGLATSPRSGMARCALNSRGRRASGVSGVRMSSVGSGPVILCPGQGAQVVGMSKAWVERSPAAKMVVDEAEAYFKREGFLGGDSLGSIMFGGPKERLDRTDIAQPAIFVASYACYKGFLEVGNAPAVAAGGLSLGEYTALVIGGSMSFLDALQLVTLRGRAMQDASEASNGTMAALLGADQAKADEAVAAGLDGAGPDQCLVPANFNAPGQVVISGSREACERAAAYAKEQMKLRVVMLDVAGAFHSPLMSPAAERLGAALAQTEISSPTIPVMSNVTALPHTDDPDTIRQRLVSQLTSPVRWENCLRYLLDHQGSADFVELAPGSTLAGMMKKIHRSKKVLGFDSPVME
mmetsp:Transcript_3762/g.7188  ORF Transcript_3762/g.7188 Transcript_3762/m.7188 type:complete len:405 (-) Transcript_3762:736-1950(-)